ncbi:MAG: 5-oxoprolinase subunit PxpA [Chthoniobacterales bacterium]
MKWILNADLGEGEPPELTRALMAHVGAANVACGGHAGTPESMDLAVSLAKANEVRLGAHPGIPGEFGRGTVAITPTNLEALLIEQIQRLVAAAEPHDLPLHHVKLHGALYHAVERDDSLAQRYCEVVRDQFPRVKIFALASGRVSHLARNLGIAAWDEYFAERGYTPAGTLIPRGQPGDLTHDLDEITRRVRGWLSEGQPGPRTICVHADSPGAVEIAATVSRLLADPRSAPVS